MTLADLSSRIKIQGRIYTTRTKQEVLMKAEEILEKAAADEEMTVEEIMQYREIVKPKVQTYGKYGTLAKEYLEKHNPSKLWALAGDLPEYLHNIDKQADELYNVMYERLSQDEKYRKTGDYLTDLQKETTIRQIIDETILSQVVYEQE